MKVDLNQLPEHTQSGLTAVIVCLGIAGSFALGRASRVEITREGIKIHRQAVVNQSELEKQLLLQQVQQAAIEELRNDIHDFARRYEAGRQLEEQVEFVADIVPQENIDELEEVIEESQHNLN